MRFKDEWFVDQRMVSEFLKNRKVIVFGAGQDGKKFAGNYRDQIEIKYFIDNSVPVGDSRIIDENYVVYNPIDIEPLSCNEVIIVCSENYYTDICDQLVKLGYEPGHDFYIWADFVADSAIEIFIAHNKNVWEQYSVSETANEVLVVYSEFHCGHTVIWSYYANVLAKMYGAKIFAYTFSTSYHPMEPKKELYKSFNVVDVIEYILTDEQKKRRDAIYENLSNNIKNKDDLLNIIINNKKYGFYIYAIYLRTVFPIFDYEKYKSEILNIIYKCVTIVVFWDDYFSNHHVKAIVMDDAISYEAIIREVALKYEIKVYSAFKAQCQRCYPGYCVGTHYGVNYKEEFKKMSQDSQNQGLEWAKRQLYRRLKGDNSDIPYMRNITAFGNSSSCRLIQKSDRIKVVICPHCFTDDPYPYGEFLFRDQYDWLMYLGELSNSTNYDWYFKIHPASEDLSRAIYKSILDKYKNIKALPLDASAVQLKEEGIDFALTLWGTLGHEYAALGINVINGGNGPHKDFDFNYNPKTFEEYDRILRHLECVDRTIPTQEIYQFYCMHYLYRRPLYMSKDDVFYPEDKLYSSDCSKSYHWVYNKNGMPYGVLDSAGTGEYKIFLDHWSPKRHKEILNEVKMYLDKADTLYNNFVETIKK